MAFSLSKLVNCKTNPIAKDTTVKLFNYKQIRTIWDDEQEKWFFSIVDVVGVLTESPNPRKYWSVLKSRLK
jgi:hypothetical protein